jgi:hypothetical protein
MNEFILLLCTPSFLFLLCTFVPLQMYHSSVWLAILYLLCHHGLFCLYLPYLTSFAHIVYRVVYTVLLTVCLFYSMCKSVSLYVSYCFALSWPGRNCKWQVVVNLPNWLNKGEKKMGVKTCGYFIRTFPLCVATPFPLYVPVRELSLMLQANYYHCHCGPSSTPSL